MKMDDLTTVAQAVAVVSACWAIISGIGAWKREFIGKRRIEIAEQALGKFFAVKDAIAFIRNPFSTTDEGKSRQRDPSETTEQSQLLDRAYLVVERYSKKESVFAEFNTLKYQFMAVFGPDTEPIFTDTNKVLVTIFNSARILAHHYWKTDVRLQLPADARRRHSEEMLRHEGIFWEGGSDPDPIRSELRVIQEKLERATAACFQEPVNGFVIMAKGWSKRLKTHFYGS